MKLCTQWRMRDMRDSYVFIQLCCDSAGACCELVTVGSGTFDGACNSTHTHVCMIPLVGSHRLHTLGSGESCALSLVCIASPCCCANMYVCLNVVATIRSVPMARTISCGILA